MEGIFHEVCSLAGTQELGKLIVFYDDNGISIDGEIDGWFTDDTPTRFRSYNWQVISDVDGHDAKAIIAAIEEARRDTSRPTLICCKTTIGSGAPNKAGSHETHGAPLGEAEIIKTREKLGWTHAPFMIPNAIYEAWNGQKKGQDMETPKTVATECQLNMGWDPWEPYQYLTPDDEVRGLWYYDAFPVNWIQLKSFKPSFS